MKKNIIISAFVIGLIASGALMYFKLYTFMIVILTLTVITAIYMTKVIFEKETPESIYRNKLNEITKTYDPILVIVKKLPDLDVKNIIVVPSFEKLADIQYELKKPIILKEDLDASSFILMDTDTAYVHTIKIDENAYCTVEKIIEELEFKNRKRRKDKKTLEELDKTTIIRLDNDKEYKVSPIRKMDLDTTKDTNVKKEIEEEKKKETKKEKTSETKEEPTKTGNKKPKKEIKVEEEIELL